MKRFVFAFQHDKIEKYGFEFLEVPFDKMDWIIGIKNNTNPLYLNFLDSMQNYGLHEFKVSGNYEFIGFYSKEIQPTDIPSVMEKWQHFFIENDIKCGSIVNLSENYTLSQPTIRIYND
jgi:hypothetical protein